MEENILDSELSKDSYKGKVLLVSILTIIAYFIDEFYLTISDTFISFIIIIVSSYYLTKFLNKKTKFNSIALVVLIELMCFLVFLTLFLVLSSLIYEQYFIPSFDNIMPAVGIRMMYAASTSFMTYQIINSGEYINASLILFVLLVLFLLFGVIQ